MSQGNKTSDRNSRLVALGLQLREAREVHAYSVAEVAERLFLSSSQVKAIEEAQYERLPAEVFVKGYLRAYAKLLDIDPEQIVNQYQPPPLAVPPPEPVAEPEPPKPLRERLPDTSTTLVFGALAALGLLFLVSVIYFSTATDSLPEEAEPASSAEPAAEHSSRAPSITPGLFSLNGANDSGSDDGNIAEPASTIEPASLEMQFSDDCWVEVRDASRKLLLADMRGAGDTEIVEGEPPYTVVLGTSQAVALRFQGRFVPVIPEPGKRSAQLVIGG
jgi:cytoskeleton protein RodZ